MKKLHIILLTVIVFFAIVLTSCDESTEVSISERVQMFEDDLNNGDYDSLYMNFHPDMVSYDSYKSASVVNKSHIASDLDPFNFGNPTISGDNASGSFTNVDGVNVGTYSAVMKEDGDNNWKFLSLTITIGDSVTFSGLSL